MNIRNNILPLFILCTLSCACFSCSNEKKEEITRMVTEWQGKEIQFPTNSTFTIQGKDTVSVNMNAEHKILVYVDSAGCTSCRLQLNKWKEFIVKVDSVAKEPVQFLFYLTPKSVKEARYITRRDDFTYPMCIDLKNEINSKNNFPKEDTFHTFLLDAKNKVQIIGNPIHNNAVRELYLNAISK
jgi:hypothetical protein